MKNHECCCVLGKQNLLYIYRVFDNKDTYMNQHFKLIISYIAHLQLCKRKTQTNNNHISIDKTIFQRIYLLKNDTITLYSMSQIKTNIYK